MFKIITLNDKRGRTHIAKNVAKGSKSKNSLCGCFFKRTYIKFVTDGDVERCTCQRCIYVLNSNLKLYIK